MADKLKFGLAVVLIIAGVTGFYVLSGQPQVLRVLSVMAGLAAGGVVAWFTEPGKRFAVFVKDAVIETRKVVWPTRKETMQMTGIVFVFVVIMAIFLWLTDKSLEWVVYDLILGWKK
ncbi:MAG: preprotein translocase subunit SecE [Betaproteobacteria bacterium]|jgi:preprotein translocase subunit SecE|nr:preprotein translocase subunit SecE [Betaproteobacteria bacterium]